MGRRKGRINSKLIGESPGIKVQSKPGIRIRKSKV
jgi:hypothetical protein